MSVSDATAIAAARARLDAHVREQMQWHFSPATGTPFWLDWARQAGWDPTREVQGLADLARFPHFQDEWLRDLPNTAWVPRALAGQPFKVFETGGTTGMPKQRVSWEDHLRDYEEFSTSLDDRGFPRGANWLMVGPTGPRRLRLTIEHLANLRGGSCYFVDVDPRWVKKLIAAKRFDEARAYLDHVVDQALIILKHRPSSASLPLPKSSRPWATKPRWWRPASGACFVGAPP